MSFSVYLENLSSLTLESLVGDYVNLAKFLIVLISLFIILFIVGYVQYLQKKRELKKKRAIEIASRYQAKI